MISDDQFLPLRYLNDFLFCERRAAMHLIEGIWVDNQFTTEGSQAHRIVDQEKDLKRGDKRNVTAMWVVSRRLGLIGKTDLVEFRDGVPYPVDFKRGKKRRWDNNEVQLCAQALCLEEMFDVTIPLGAIFHIKSQHRQEVEFNTILRATTETTAHRLRQMIESSRTPAPKYKPRCRGCSLMEWCLPKAFRPRATAVKYLKKIVDGTSDEVDDPS